MCHTNSGRCSIEIDLSTLPSPQYCSPEGSSGDAVNKSKADPNFDTRPRSHAGIENSASAISSHPSSSAGSSRVWLKCPESSHSRNRTASDTAVSTPSFRLRVLSDSSSGFDINLSPHNNLTSQQSYGSQSYSQDTFSGSSNRVTRLNEASPDLQFQQVQRSAQAFPFLPHARPQPLPFQIPQPAVSGAGPPPTAQVPSHHQPSQPLPLQGLRTGSSNVNSFSAVLSGTPQVPLQPDPLWIPPVIPRVTESHSHSTPSPPESLPLQNDYHWGSPRFAYNPLPRSPPRNLVRLTDDMLYRPVHHRVQPAVPERGPVSAQPLSNPPTDPSSLEPEVTFAKSALLQGTVDESKFNSQAGFEEPVGRFGGARNDKASSLHLNSSEGTDRTQERDSNIEYSLKRGEVDTYETLRDDETQPTTADNKPGDKPKVSNPWQACSSFAKKIADEEYAGWKAEVDNLLIFAGLFSGVVTAFTLKSYAAVDKGDPAHMTVLLLETLVRQHDNATNPLRAIPEIDTNPQIHVFQSARRINTLWFSSLALSLSTAVLGILCLQWIREAGRSAYTSHHENLAIRYLRQEGMQQWQVTRILKLLPALLLVSLLLFFAGLMEVVLQIDGILSVFPTVIMGGTVMIVLFTTLAPTLQSLLITSETKQPQCPYKSPQSWIVHRAAVIIYCFIRFLMAKCSALENSYIPSPASKIQTWLDYDNHHMKCRQKSDTPGIPDVGKALGWITTTSKFRSQDLAEAVLRCLRDLEDSAVLDAFVAQTAQLRERDNKQKVKYPYADQQENKLRYTQELILVHTLELMTDTVEARYMSKYLLTKQIELFLRINGTKLTANVTIACPINRNNVDQIHIDVKKQVLRCINQMLKWDMDCNESHIQRGMFAILYSILLEQTPSSECIDLVQETLDVVFSWIEKREELEQRLKLGVVLRKLRYACQDREKEFAIIQCYCYRLDEHVARKFGRELQVRNYFKRAGPKLEYLYKYLAWRELEGHSEDAPFVNDVV